MIFFSHQLNASRMAHGSEVMGRRGVAVSILACQAKGRGFKSRRLRTQRIHVRKLIGMGQLIRQLAHSFMEKVHVAKYHRINGLRS